MDWHWLWLAVAAFLAGVLNAVAGGGSFLSFPALLGMKILPVQANATNTVAIWPGQLTSVWRVPGGLEKPALGMADGPGGIAGRHGRGGGAAEYAAEDIHAPGAMAAAVCRFDFCGQRTSYPLA